MSVADEAVLSLVGKDILYEDDHHSEEGAHSITCNGVYFGFAASRQEEGAKVDEL